MQSIINFFSALGLLICLLQVLMLLFLSAMCWLAQYEKKHGLDLG